MRWPCTGRWVVYDKHKAEEVQSEPGPRNKMKLEQ